MIACLRCSTEWSFTDVAFKSDVSLVSGRTGFILCYPLWQSQMRSFKTVMGRAEEKVLQYSQSKVFIYSEKTFCIGQQSVMFVFKREDLKTPKVEPVSAPH